MAIIDWDAVHGYAEWGQLLARLLQAAHAAPDAAARTAAEQHLTQFRVRVPGYGDDLSELARQALNALLLADIGAGLQQLAALQQQLDALLHHPSAAAPRGRATPVASPQALKEASSWLLALARQQPTTNDSPPTSLTQQLAQLQQRLLQLLATQKDAPATKPTRRRHNRKQP